MQQKGVQPEHNLRGIFTADENGRYWLRAIKPKFYPLPDDGPVGKLIGALGRHPYRPVWEVTFDVVRTRADAAQAA